jgi:hypothetical protein
MKTKILSFVAMALVLILSACSPLAPQSPSDEPPVPVVEDGYQPVDVDQVEVEVGVGSPIPVAVIVSGNLPDSCAQIEFAQLLQDESNFHLTLSTVPSNAEGCIQDSLPFRIKLPLNVIGLPAGSYTVEVNGSRADFSLDSGSSTSSLPTVYSAFYKDDIQVNSVNVEIGQGSPIPVHAIVSLNLPNSCAQLGEIRLHRDGTMFFVRLIAYVIEGDDCKADSIPFPAEIPLNIVNLPERSYKVNVNGVKASFDLRAVPVNSQQ